MYSLSARNSEDSYIGDLDNEKPLRTMLAMSEGAATVN